MAQSNEPPIHIPSFAKPLAPYIKPRQDALRIRQALTSHLRSFIICDDSTDPAIRPQSHLSQSVPTDAVIDVKRIPADLPGIRKEYLRALQANVVARKNYRTACEEVATLRRQRVVVRGRSAETADPQEPGADLRDYVQLLRDRRRHTKLQLFQHYLQELNAKRAGEPQYLDTERDSGQQYRSLLLPDAPDADLPGRGGAGTDLEDLVHKLERAVVQARNRLDAEKLLFERIKSQHDSRNGESQNEEVMPQLKAQALQQTRDELVQWVEERLSSEVDPDESLLHDLHPEEIEEAQRLLEHQMVQISGQYAAYLRARRDLLDAASRACQPITVTSKPPARMAPRADLVSEELPAPDPSDVVSYTNETLLPLFKSQKALALQKSYLTGLLAKEKAVTLRALHRLSDESHLLPEYPILARESRFQHAVAALTPRSSHTSSDRPQTDEVVDLADAWAFASDAAAVTERDYVQQKVMLGTEVARDTRKLLGDVYSTLNQDLEEVLRAGVERVADVSDIWASEARSTRRVGVVSSSGSRAEKRPRGPWSGLNGRVGVE